MRLFIALPLPTEIEEMLGAIIFALKQKRGRIKWVASKNIHLTAKFLGETEDSKIDKIKASITDLISDFPPARCTIDTLGGFPNLNRPRVIWAGLSGQIDILREISTATEDKMAHLGFEKENRQFKPHLTLGRVKDNRNIRDLVEYIKEYQINPAEFAFDRLVLFKSVLTPQGPIYTRLHEAFFKA
jgi:2'-5' RNA ligase